MTQRIALAGNPNTGKTSLFNRLTGSAARVGNYPGVTVEREEGTWKLPGGPVQVVDVPGTYSLAARSREEQVAVRALLGLDGQPRPVAAVVVLDSTQLVRNLYFALQVIEANIPVVLALNLIDIAREQGIVPDLARLRRRLGVPVIPVSARTGEGMAELGVAVERVLAHPETGRADLAIPYAPGVEAAIARLLPLAQTTSLAEARALALWSLLSIEVGDELMDVPERVRQEVHAIRRDAAQSNLDMDGAIVGARYAFLDAEPLSSMGQQGISLTSRIDAWALHPVYGLGLFVMVMGILFQALFSWSDPLISAIENVFSWIGEGAEASLPAGILRDLLVDGVIGGVGSVLVFLPQILMLFLLLGILEDSGYMSRVAFLVDRAMKALGLHGRAFVPMLSGYACAIPAIMATRTLESRRDRLLTMLVVPLMSCSARLPVYTLIIASLFPSTKIWGIIPAQGTLMAGMYLFSTTIALLAAGILGRTVLKGRRIPLLMELPPYRLPRMATVLQQMWMRARSFLTDAGTVILACTILLWGLLNFPQNVPLSKDYAALEAQASPEEVIQLHAQARSEQLQGSYAGQLGQTIAPAIAPLGFDWKIGIGLVGAFAAREVFVSTMGLVYGIGEDVDADSLPLRERMAAERNPDGSPIYTPLTGLSLMVFFALSAQCMSTLAAIKRESQSWGWTGFLFAYMTVLAWSASFIVYQGGKLLGFGG